jgi:regulator of ribonuclease activity A
MCETTESKKDVEKGKKKGKNKSKDKIRRVRIRASTPLVFQSTCDLFDKYEDSARVPVVCWRNLGGEQQFCGRAVTVKCFEDNSRVEELFETPGNHHVMVIDGGASMRHALVCDRLADLAAINNWAGVIVHGCVRDETALATIPFGVLAMGTTPRKAVQRGEGQVDLAVRIGDVVVYPGDLVYADEDGLLVLNPDDVEAISESDE